MPLSMTNDKGILIRNVYYMLSYAFQELRTNHYEDVDKEDFKRIVDLFAEILYKGVSMQLKQGLYREYIERHESLPLLRGRLDIHETIRHRIQHKRLLGCEYDELSENNLFNRILKSTALLLIHNKDVQRKRKSQLRSLLTFFGGVDEVDLSRVRWSDLRFQRHNHSYKMLMNICYFIVDGTLLTTESGEYRMPTFSDEHMNKLYERFVLEYYRAHHTELRANADMIQWDIDNREVSVIEFLPAMRTDITLCKGNRTLIIDTKYYSRMTQSHFNKATIHSANMFQIFTYVNNYDKADGREVSGMLLYAKTNEDIKPDLDAIIKGNRYLVRTIDLNEEFSCIRRQLDDIVELVFPQEVITN